MFSTCNHWSQVSLPPVSPDSADSAYLILEIRKTSLGSHKLAGLRHRLLPNSEGMSTSKTTKLRRSLLLRKQGLNQSARHRFRSLGARIPGTSDYMLRTLRALVKCTWILISDNNLGTFEMYPQHLSNMEPLRKFW